ncbi:MAG: CYTH domain-containing protein [Bacilli bacterium]
MKETEIKIELAEDDISLLLRKYNWREWSDLSFEKTYGFFKPDGNSNVFPRIKVIDSEITMGVKVKKGESKYFERNEIEMKIEDLQTGIDFFKALGFTDIVIFEKKRKKLLTDSVELCLDQLPFGYFLEIEGEKKEIEKVLKKLAWNKKPRINDAYLVCARKRGITSDVLFKDEKN